MIKSRTSNQYYLFQRNAAGTLLFSVIDMNQQGNRTNGLPAGVVTQKNVQTQRQALVVIIMEIVFQ